VRWKQGAAEDPPFGKRAGLRVYLVCGWPALVSSLMMIHKLQKRVNTFCQKMF